MQLGKYLRGYMFTCLLIPLRLRQVKQLSILDNSI